MRIPMLAALICTAACTTASTVPVTPRAPSEIRVLNASVGATPAASAVTRTTVYESARTVTQVLRLAANARIAEHHHPFYDETFIVQQGRISLLLNGKPFDIGVGDFIVMPAGTTISGMNPGEQEARVVVAFSSTGAAGPLGVPGPAHH
ncbi:MAG: cupin domain-containing protein [Gemmatimonadaceae bacterium]